MNVEKSLHDYGDELSTWNEPSCSITINSDPSIGLPSSTESSKAKVVEITPKNLTGVFHTTFTSNSLFFTIVKYCPVVSGQLNASVFAIGIVGVWRTTQLEFDASDELVAQEMENEECQFQPEAHNFHIIEISCGTYVIATQA